MIAFSSRRRCGNKGGKSQYNVALWNRFKGMPLCYETLHLIATESHDWSDGIGLMYFFPQAGIHLRWSSYVGLSVETHVRLWGRQRYRLRKKLMATRGPTQRIQLYVAFRQHQSGGRKAPVLFQLENNFLP